jgi:hypothetical protein
VTVYGSGFAPGVQVNFVLRRDRDGAITAANGSSGGPPASADGTFIRPIPLVGCGPQDSAGSTFTITMVEYRPDNNPPFGPGASATFTVTAPTTTQPGLPNTGGGWTPYGGVSLWAAGLGLALLIAVGGAARRFRRR